MIKIIRERLVTKHWKEMDSTYKGVKMNNHSKPMALVVLWNHVP